MEGSLSIIVFKKPKKNSEEIFHLSFLKNWRRLTCNEIREGSSKEKIGLMSMSVRFYPESQNQEEEYICIKIYHTECLAQLWALAKQAPIRRARIEGRGQARAHHVIQSCHPSSRKQRPWAWWTAQAQTQAFFHWPTSLPRGNRGPAFKTSSGFRPTQIIWDNRPY